MMYVVALLASHGNEKSKDLAALHHTFLKIAEECGLPILSMASDGAAVEVSAQGILNHATQKLMTFDFQEIDIHIKIPLCGQTLKPLVTVPDPKNA